MRVGPPAALVVVAAFALGGCGGNVASLSLPNPPAVTVTTAAPQQTLPPGLDNVDQSPVAGSTTTTAPSMRPGDASLDGTVLGPAGPVAGATVEVDRFVGDSMATTELTTRADGSWSLAGILGGRYRVRAWQPPSLDMVDPQIFFLSSTQQLSLTLKVSKYKGPNISVAINPPAPVVDQPVNLVVEVTDPTVGTDGVITNPPVTGVAVTLVGGPDWQVANGNPLTTGADGQVLFQVSCTTAGYDPLSAQAGTSAPVPLQMPSCSEPPPPPTVPPTTEAPAPTTTCPPPSTTSTTGGIVLGQGGGPPQQAGC